MLDSSNPNIGTGTSAEDDLLQEFLQRRKDLLARTKDKSKINERLERTIDFLRMLRPAGPWQVTAINPYVEKDIVTRTIRSTDRAREFLYEHNGHRNLYYSVNPVRVENRKAAKTDIAAIEFLPGDLDPKDDETPEAAKQRYLEAVKSFQPVPTFVIDSGNGLNALWRLDQPIKLPKPVKGKNAEGKPSWVLTAEAQTLIGDIESRSKALMVKLESVAGTQNIDRILRLPWTVNLPNRVKIAKGRKPCLTSLVAFNGLAVSKLDEFPLHTGTESEPPSRKDEGEKPASKLDWTLVEKHRGWLKGVADLPPVGFSAKGKAIIAHSGNLKDLNFDLDEAGLLPKKDDDSGDSKPYETWSHVSFALAAIFKADGRYSVEQIAAALTADLDCNQHITKIKDQAKQQRAVERLISRSHSPSQLRVRPGEPDWRERLKSGSPAPSMHNARLAIMQLGITAMYDTFHNRMLFGFKDDTVKHSIQQFFGEVSDNGIMALRQLMSERFGFDLTEKHTRDAVVSLALEHCFDPVLDMLAEAEANWDKVGRLDKMAVNYFNCEDTPLNAAFMRKTMIAAVARVRVPGCKKDEILVLESDEGYNKSTAWRVLAGDQNFSDEKIIGKESREVQEQLAGIWVHENADLAGMKKAEVETVKAYASRQIDIARPAYGYFAKKQKRRSIEVGTTNSSEYLQSQTGNRRFWPMRVFKTIDIEKLKRDRLQLWGEAAYYQSQGESLVLNEELWSDAGHEQEARRVGDPWEEALRSLPEWITTHVRKPNLQGQLEFKELDVRVIHQEAGQDRVAASDLLEHVLKISPGNQTTLHSMRLSTVMKKLGWERATNGYVSITGLGRVKGYYRQHQ